MEVKLLHQGLDPRFLLVSFRDCWTMLEKKPGIKTIAFSLRVGSREAITPRPSLLDPDVRLSPHPAPDVLSLRFCVIVTGKQIGRAHV